MMALATMTACALVSCGSDGSETLKPKTFTVDNNGMKVSFKMMPVQAGMFTMGATDEQGSAQDNEKPSHLVNLSEDYYMGETEVTQELWEAVMGSNPSEFTGKNLPVEQVSWDDCQQFVMKLNALTGEQFRLPTEAEWEFAARGGNKSKYYQFSGSNTIENVAWFIGNSSKTHPVKSKKSNELGIYDMSGNVWEWCQDWYGTYSGSSVTDPVGPTTGTDRLLRGGSWDAFAVDTRVASRVGVRPDRFFTDAGLRLAL